MPAPAFRGYAASLGDQRVDRSVRLADVQVTLTPGSSLAVMPAIRRFQANSEDASTFVGVSAVTASARGSLWGSIGQWSGGAGDGMPWSAGGRLRLHRLVSLDVGARHETFDPLYLSRAQTSWSVGLSVLIGRRAPLGCAPVPAAYVNGRATIHLPVVRVAHAAVDRR